MTDTKTLLYPVAEINELLARVKESSTVSKSVTDIVDGGNNALVTSGGVAQAIAQAKTDITSNLDDYYVADFIAKDIFSGGDVKINPNAITAQLDKNKFFLVPYDAAGGVCIAAGEYDEDSLRFSIYAPEGIAVVNAKLSSILVTADMVSTIKFDDISRYVDALNKGTEGVVVNAYGQLYTIDTLPITSLVVFLLDVQELGDTIISVLNKRTNDIGSNLETVTANVSDNMKAIIELNDKTDNLENNKANIDGRYENMTSGFAENLTGRGDAIVCRFTEQPTGDTLSIKSGVARFKSIYGNTMRFRQEWPNDKFSNGVAPFSSKSSLSVNYGVLKIRKNATEAIESTSASLPTIANNSYYFSVEVRSGSFVSGSKPYIQVIGMQDTQPYVKLEDTEWHRIEAFGVASRSLVVAITIPAGVEEGSYIEVRNPQLFNISELGTLMCPINNADEFRKMFPDEYYPYSEKHKLVHMGNDYIRTQGFNAAEVSGEGYSAELLGGKTYYIGGGRVDIDSITFDGEAVSLEPDMLFTPYKRGVLYCEGHNVCVNLHHSGYRDGEYQAFWRDAKSIPRLAEIFPNGMKSVGLTYDELTEEYAVKRVEMVDMASLEWRALSSGVYYAMISGIASAATVMCDIYTPATSPYTVSNGYNTLADRTIYAYRDSAGVVSGVIIKDTNYPDPTQFIENIREGKIIYRLASEVKTRFREHEVSLEYIVDDFGTERVTSLDTYATFPCAPMVANIVYDFNAVDEIRSNRNNIADLLARVEALEAAIATPIAEPIEEEL